MAAVTSRYAYADGANGLFVAIVRSVIMVAAVAVGLRLRGIGLGLPRELYGLAMLNGVLMAAMTWGNIGAIEFIAIGLAQLLFFTFPIIIAVLVIVLRLETVQPAKLVLIALAFAGMALMLGTSLGTVDWRGTALALMAAFATAANALVVMRWFRGVNVFVATVHFSLWGLVALVALGSTAVAVRMPDGNAGWIGAVGVGVLQTIGTPMYIYCIARIGALRTGMGTNVQPVAAIALAWLLFGELLTPEQAVGGAIVLGAIAAMQWTDLRRQARSVAA